MNEWAVEAAAEAMYHEDRHAGREPWAPGIAGQHWIEIDPDLREDYRVLAREALRAAIPFLEARNE